MFPFPSFGPQAQRELEGLPAVAREAIRARLEGRSPRLPAPAGLLGQRAPVFVTLRRAGRLRGCIGSLAPIRPNLVEETADRAIAAAFEDPRFPPVGPGEIDDLEVEVSILQPAEPVASLAELDPRRFGVVVSDRYGRRGVLLPDIEGVDTPEQQVEIARRKAGIPPGEPVSVERFEVIKVSEGASPDR